MEDFEIDFEPRQVSIRKKSSEWCRRRLVGKAHTTIVTLDERYSNRPCRTLFNGKWACNHFEVCTTCGKVTQWFVRCPDLPEGVLQMGIDK